MKLTKLYKDQSSGSEGRPTVYLAESGDFVVQGHLIGSATEGELENVLPGESAVLISADVVLGAIARYNADQKH